MTKYCCSYYISNKTKVIRSPNGMAASFERIKSYLPDPIPHDYQPITKMGFEFIFEI